MRLSSKATRHWPHTMSCEIASGQPDDPGCICAPTRRAKVQNCPIIQTYTVDDAESAIICQKLGLYKVGDEYLCGHHAEAATGKNREELDCPVYSSEG